MNTRFNVYFNGMNSYNEGIKNIQKANKEDYSVVIPMYPISHHSNASSASSSMDLTIEKCRKAIKLHSIKVKPKKDYKKSNSPEYKLWYNQQEFNPAMGEAWLLLGKAEFHKADFLGSVGTFSYITRHYTNDKNIEAVCQLWIARAYGEMGWIYEAEQMLSKVSQDNLNRSNIGLYASVNADLLLKKKQYKDAIPFLELALSKESDKTLQQRFGYILAQLYHLNNDDKAAYAAFTKVIKSNPPYEMDFNARISRTQLGQGNISSIRKDLKAMIKNRSNKDYLDQLYYALGNTYLHHADTAKAIENYKLSIEKSSRKGIDKAMTLITLGDLYYFKHKYALAQPCYEEAGKIITNENDNYGRVTKRAQMLNELVTQNDIVVLQDSLQQLSTLSETKRLEVVNKIIAKLIADEKVAADKALKDKQQQQNAIDDNLNFPPIGSNPGIAGDWYFYNVDLIRNGQSEFIKVWGNRKLEDNWRRTNKSASLFANDRSIEKAAKDSTDTLSKSAVVSDNKKPEFYLRQIPNTPAQIAKSTSEIATALFSMGQIYKDKIEDIPLAINTFKEFIRRFPNDVRVADAYYFLYLMQSKMGNDTEANSYQNKIINEFPDSKYHKILSEPNYINRLERMYREQDSIYNLTYKAYVESDFKTVFNQVAFIKQKYPLSTLMPKFVFLNALSIGKKESPDTFKTALSDLIKTFPQSDVSAMAKDILALMNQGKEAKNGTSSGSLLTRREESTKTEINEITPQQFSTDKQTKHRLMLIGSLRKEKMNKLLYSIATFNFSRFMIKDFDLVVSKLDTAQQVLSVTNFESFDEVSWYINSLNSDAQISALLTDYQVKKVIISEDNYALIKTSYGLVDYLAFLNKPANKNPDAQVASNKSAKKPITKNPDQKNTQVEIKQPSKPLEIAENKLEIKPIGKPVAKPVENKVIAETQKPTITQKPDSIKKPEPVVPVIQPKPEPEAPLFKGLFAYKANEAHFAAIYILSGTIDFNKTKVALDEYNAKNYGLMNLKVTLETVDKIQVIIIGSLSNAQIAKSYLLRMVKEKGLFDGLKGSNYRNLIGSQRNLNVVIQQNALNQYFEFMQEYYLK